MIDPKKSKARRDTNEVQYEAYLGKQFPKPMVLLWLILLSRITLEPLRKLYRKMNLPIVGDHLSDMPRIMLVVYILKECSSNKAKYTVYFGECAPPLTEGDIDAIDKAKLRVDAEYQERRANGKRSRDQAGKNEVDHEYTSEVSATVLDLLNCVYSIPSWIRDAYKKLNWQTERIKKILTVNDVTMTPTCQILNALVWVSFLMCASNLGVLIGTFIFPGIFPYLFGRHGTMILAIVVLPIFMRMKLKAEKFEYNVETRRSLLLYSLNMGIMLGSLFPLDYFHHVLTLPLLPLCLAFSYQILRAGFDRRLSVSLGCFGLSSLLFGAAFFSFNSLSLLNIYSHLTTLAVTTLMLMFILGEIRTPEQTSAGYEMFLIMLVAIVRMMADSLGRPYTYKYYY